MRPFRTLLLAMIGVVPVVTTAAPCADIRIGAAVPETTRRMAFSDTEERPALYAATEFTLIHGGCPDDVNLLIERGADPNAHVRYPFDLFDFRLHGSSRWLQPDNRRTVLMLASDHGHLDFVRLFLRAGADPNRRDRSGKTALMLAASSGHVEVVEALLSAGADVTAFTKGCWGCSFDESDSVLRAALHWSRRNNKDPALPLLVLARLKQGDLPTRELDNCLALRRYIDPALLPRIEALKGDR